MSKKNKLKFWEKNIRCWRESKLKKKEYCDLHKISPFAMDYWIGKLRKNKISDFIKVVPPPEIPTLVERIIKIKLPKGIQIELPSETELNTLCGIIKGVLG